MDVDAIVEEVAADDGVVKSEAGQRPPYPPAREGQDLDRLDAGSVGQAGGGGGVGDGRWGGGGWDSLEEGKAVVLQDEDTAMVRLEFVDLLTEDG